MRTDYGQYRVQVDLMGDKYLGGNTILFLVDGLWGSSEANDPPRKFQMSPFNNDWTSSIFMSQDQVALESVCFDFLKAEYTADRKPFYGDYPQMAACDDYINQAADSSYWPKGFKYDPENDVTSISSLGCCEHWNNQEDKQYSRNLNSGDGIELVFINNNATDVKEVDSNLPTKLALLQNYPNPFNPTTNIKYSIPASLNPSKGETLTQLKIYDILGREVIRLVNETKQPGEYEVEFNASNLASGVYLYRLDVGNQHITKKIMLLK